MIDSFKALHPYAESQGDFRRFLHDLAARLSVVPVTSFWVGEYGRDDATEAPEFAVADAIVSLHSEQAGERERRVLQVLKLRGSAFMSGQHAYRLSGEGFDVFPRLADAIDLSSYKIFANESPPASPSSTRCSPTATGLVHRRSWRALPVPARR